MIIVNAEFASDFRYAQFYTEDEFCHYNMFNHHCFDGEVRPDTLCLASTDFQFCFFFNLVCLCVRAQASNTVLKSFLKEHNGEKVVLVADPPFGGLVRPLARSFSLISQTWRQLQGSGQFDQPKEQMQSFTGE